MRPAAEELQHLLRLGRRARLPQHPDVADDQRVDPEHRLLRRVFDGARFPDRMLERIVAALLVARRDDLERDLELSEDRAPLR